jgi:uncharacterized protein involved in exopolysaccharide biosynthesis
MNVLPSRPDPRLSPHRVAAEPEAADLAASASDTAGDYIRLLAARWRLFSALTLAGLAAGGLISLRARPIYESGVTLAVAEPKTRDGAPRTDGVKDFVTLLENHATAADTIRRFKLDESPYNLGSAEFLLRVARAEQIGQTNLLRLTIRIGDARLAADIANDMASRARDLTRRLTDEETTLVRQRLGKEFEQARQRFETAQGLLEKAKADGQLDLLKRDVATLLEQRRELSALNVKIAGERALIVRAEAELGRRERIDRLMRTIDSDSTLREAARESGASSVLGLSLKNEVVNQSYDNLDSQLSRSRAELSGYERQREQLTRESGLDKPSFARLSQLYALETRVARMEVDVELARRVYLELATQYEQVRNEVASRTATLQIVDPAYVPTRPEPRHAARNAAVGGLAGLLLAVTVILVGPLLAAPRRPLDA